MSGPAQTILVVEPYQPVLDTIDIALESQHYTVLRAGTAETAFAICKDHGGPIHLLVTETALDGIDGAALVERLREFRPDVPALFVSCYFQDDLIAKGWLKPGAPFLQKPFTADALLCLAAHGPRPKRSHSLRLGGLGWQVLVGST